MTKPQNKNKVLKSVVYFLATIGFATHLGAAELHGFEFRGDRDVLRFSVENEPGTMANSGLDAKGQSLIIDFKGITQDRLKQVIAEIKGRHDLVGEINAIAMKDNVIRLVISLKESMDVLDETIAAMAADRSRWEIVLNRHAIVEELTNIALKASSDGQLNLTLKGGPELQAKATARTKPNELWIDFPKLSKAQLAPVLEQFQLEDPLVSGMNVTPLGKTGTRVVLKIKQAFKLADPVETREAQSASILFAVRPGVAADPAKAMAAAPADRPVDEAKARLLKALAAIELRENKGMLEVVLDGSAVNQAKTEIQDNPSRLIVELRGVSRPILEEFVSGIRSTSPIFLGARVGKSTRSATQVVFDLSKPVKIASRTQESPSEQAQRLVVVLDYGGAELARAADALKPQVAVAEPPVSLEPLGPVRTIKPLTLGSAATGAKPVRSQADAAELDLMQFLDKALLADSKYLSAKANYQANSESVPQARAGLLPTASFDYQRTNTRQDALSNTPGSTTVNRSYPNKGGSLTLTQPIIKVPAVVKLEQAKVLDSQARVGLLASEQELIVRVATTYLTFLAAQDNVELSKAEKEALEQQAQVARTRLSSGLGTQAQLQDTEGRFALSQAREVEARNKLEDAKGAAKEILGVGITKLKPFVGDFDPAMPQPSSTDLWVDAALEQNLSLQSQNMAVEVAALEVRRQHTAHYPTLNLIVSASNSNQGDSLIGGSFVGGSSVKSRDVALKLNVSLFEGGMTSSLVRESLARQEKALQDRDAEYRKTERMARSSLLGVVSGAQTLGALRKALVAQQSALQTRQEGMRSGIYSVVQVADAYRLYFAAKRDYLQARYDYLLNRLKLKQAVGSLSRADLEDLANLMQ